MVYFVLLHDLLCKELTLLTWGAVSGPHEDCPGPIPICVTSGRQCGAQSQMPLHFLLFSTQLRKNKGNSFRICSVQLQPFSSFTCCLFYSIGTFYMITSPTQPKASMTEPMAHTVFCPFGEMLVRRSASFNGRHYPIHIKIHLKFLNIGRTMYVHCTLLQKTFAVFI